MTAPTRTVLPRQLPTPAPTWTRDTQVVIVGSGAAGLSAALHLAAARVPTVVVTRGEADESATAWAQGGLAAVWDAAASADAHVAATLAAGAGLGEPDAVRALVAAAPAAIRRLIELGATFDRDAAGGLDLHLEGGHRHRRIVHAGGDATALEVERALVAALHGVVGSTGTTVDLLTHTRAVDVLTDADGRACGVRVRTADGVVGDLLAPAVVLASGGMGQLWPLTTTPTVATGDGLAMALRAGAVIRDAEFVQFHPTVLVVPPGHRVPGDRGVLVSEAVRGEGAVLVDAEGDRVMAGVHPLADLAPRDVVAAAMRARMAATGAGHLYLDGTGFGAEAWERRFPSVLDLCRARGVDPVTEPIPVRPAAHYSCGGVAADLTGATSVPGLYAVGEVAATGVQGANRLASNSVTEALVAGDRVGALLVSAPRIAGGAPAQRPTGALRDPAALPALREAMDRGAGVLRDEEGLRAALGAIESLPAAGGPLDDAALDATNLHACAALVVRAALARTESRGCHRRADHPDAAPAWRTHVTQRLDASGRLVLGTQPLTTRTSNPKGEAA